MDVNVLTMAAAVPVPHRTVIVEHGSISRIVPAATAKLPPGAFVIPGRGTRYLMPGLADMHTHSVDPVDMRWFLAAGITTILDLGYAPGDATPGFATPSFVRDERAQYDTGAKIGPRVFAAFMIDGPQWGRDVHDSADVASKLATLRANGYEFLKVHGGFVGPFINTVLDQAARANTPVVGHLPRRVPLADVAGRMAMVAHAEEFLYTVFADSLDASRIADVVGTLARAGTYVTPTLATYRAVARLWGHPQSLDSALSAVEAQRLTPKLRDFWRSNTLGRQPGSLERQSELLNRLVLALQRGGVPLLAGTDAPSVPWMFPGSSIHDELTALVAAGLTPYEALSAATRSPGEFMARYAPGTTRFGVVAEGVRADLLLVDSNPLDDLRVLRAPVGVMRGGVWFDRNLLASDRRQD